MMAGAGGVNGDLQRMSEAQEMNELWDTGSKRMEPKLLFRI